MYRHAKNPVVLVALVLLLVLGMYFFNGGGTDELEDMRTVNVEETPQTDEEVDGMEKSMSGEGTFRELMMQGESMVCDVRYVPQNANAVAGTLYVDDRRMFGSYEMEQGGEVYLSNMLLVDGRMYTWAESEFGSYAATFAVGGEEEGNVPVSLEDELVYDCEAWEADEARFVVPAGIEFKDMDALFAEPNTQEEVILDEE